MSKEPEIGDLMRQLQLNTADIGKIGDGLKEADALGIVRELKEQNAIPKIFDGLETVIGNLEPAQIIGAVEAIQAVAENPIGKYMKSLAQLTEPFARYDSLLKEFSTLHRPEYLESINVIGSLVRKKFEATNGVQEAFDRLNERLEATSSYSEDEIESPDFEQKVTDGLSEDVREGIIPIGSWPFQLMQRIFRDPSHMREIDPRNFEEFIAYLVEQLGFEDVILTPESGDGGRDVIARISHAGIPVIYSFECKRYSESNKIGVDVMRNLLGSVTASRSQANVGVLVTTSSFTKGATQLIAEEARLDGKDYQSIMKWIEDVTVRR